MQRLIALTFAVPAVLAAAELAKPQPRLLDRVLAPGVTNDRPYRPVSRIDAPYQAARTVIARVETQLMAGTLKTSPASEIAAVRTAIEAEVVVLNALTEHERHQFEQTVRDLDALLDAMAAVGLGGGAAPAVTTPPAAPAPAPVDPPVAAPPEMPAELPADTPADKPAEPPAEIPAEIPAEMPADKPAEAPAELPAEIPAELPADTPAEPPVEAPAELPAEIPAEVPAEVPADKPAELPAELPVPAEKPADALPPE
jgi:hypothetical protein